MARNRTEYFVHEGYARRLGNRRFVGGLILGMLITWTLPAFKLWRKACDDRYVRKENYDISKTEDETSEEITFTDEDFE